MSEVNWDNMRALLARLQYHAEHGLETKFNMGQWCEIPVNPNERRGREQEFCYTSACLAGHAVLLTGTVEEPLLFSLRMKTGPFVGHEIPNAAAKLLGLSSVAGVHKPSQANWMFYGLWHPSMRAERNQEDIFAIHNSSSMSLNDAITYLDKAIRERNIFVTIDKEIN